MEINQLTSLVIKSCIKIHSTIGPGCFEKVYEEILCYELHKAGLEVKRQVLLPVAYEELFIEDAYKLDILVENRSKTWNVDQFQSAAHERRNSSHLQ